MKEAPPSVIPEEASDGLTAALNVLEFYKASFTDDEVESLKVEILDDDELHSESAALNFIATNLMERDQQNV